ncbi:MAG: ferredoxin [Lachnospiraceae bacterium]|nr:ferredoxin [Lachnospiraceae bacterium]
MCDEVFRMNEYDKAEAYQPANDDNQSAVQDAIDSYPVSAIAWED